MSVSLYTVAKDVWDFMKHPKFDHLPGYFKANPLEIFPYLLLLDYMMMILLVSFISMVGLEDMDHKLEDIEPWMLAVQAVLFAPVFEEALFRLPMKYSFVRMFAACCIGLAMLFAFIESEMIIGLIAIVFFLIVALFHFTDQGNDNKWNAQIAPLWETYFYIPFWTLTVCFAFLHLTNFKSEFPFYLAPILILPQFFLGALLGYIRTGFGFVFAVLFHALHNGVIVGLAFMAQAALPNT